VHFSKFYAYNRGRVRHLVKARSDEEEPDWDKEMSIFKQRTMRSNQLATLRELESKVDLGRVSTRKDHACWHQAAAAAAFSLH